MKCNICGNVLNISFCTNPSKTEILGFRETLSCSNCDSISRDRMLMWSLSNCVQQKNHLFRLDKNKKIKIFESFGLRHYPNLLHEKFSYLNTKFSKFDPFLRIKFLKKADLQKLYYPDSSFDIVIISDVLEHVRDDFLALSEIYRILNNDGYLFITIPFDYELEQTKIKVKVEGKNNIFLEPPQYHNNHLPGESDGGDSLSYRDYGYDIFSMLQKIGFKINYFEAEILDFGISQQDVFICRKNNVPYHEFLKQNNVKIIRHELFT